MTETLREKLIRCGWVTPFNADTLVELINKHCADVIRDATNQVVPREAIKDPTWTGEAYKQRQDTRAELLAIAAELEGQL